ncbi:MAG: iron ABC transporter permease [Rhizobiales bacterium]|nr:iron ABC transporter permease [Hyphomicrobiales bacterium]
MAMIERRTRAPAFAGGPAAPAGRRVSLRLPGLGVFGDAAVYLVFFLLIGLPLGIVLAQAVMPHLFDGGTTDLSAAPLQRAFASPRVALSILHSVVLGGLVAGSATLLGGMLAFLVQRFRLPMRGGIAAMPWLVFLTPSYLKALAWILLMAPGGYLAQAGLMPRVLGEAFFGLPGLVFVHTLSLFPLPFFIIGSALSGLGCELEDAARLAGAGPIRVWMKVNGPLLAPAIALSAIATFAEVLSDFGMATTIARMSSFGVLTYGIYAAASDYPVDFPMAGAQSLVLLGLVLIVLVADRLLRRQTGFRLISGRTRPARRYDPGAWRWLLLVLALAVTAAALLLPLGAIALRAFTKTLGIGLGWNQLTFDHLSGIVLPGSDIHAALTRSLAYAGLTAFIACGFGLLLALRLEATRGALRPIVLAISLGAVAIPGIVLAFGYILVWNRLPGFRDWPLPHYGDASLLVTGYVAAALPYCLVIILSATGQLAPNLTEAARLFGAGPARRLLRIVLPLVAVSIGTAFAMTFIRTVFELPVSQLLIPKAGAPAPPIILKLFSHEMDGAASALSLASMIVAGGIAGLVWLLARRFAADRGQRRLRPAPMVETTS